MRGSLRFPWLLWVAGCLGPPPREPTLLPPPPGPSKRIVIGGETDVEASWAETCTKSGWTFEHGQAEHDAPGVGSIERKTTGYPCHEQPFQITTTCNLACEALDASDARYAGYASVRVRALQLGVLTISLELIHTDTHEHRSKDLTVAVVPPDAFQMQCMNPSATWGPCERGLLVENPMIRVWALLDGRLVRSALLRVNGAANSQFIQGVSLATVLGAEIHPGTYELKVSAGDKATTFSVEAREPSQ